MAKADRDVQQIGWKIYCPNGERHVVPVADFRDHVINRQCWCLPDDDEGIVVHNSMDQRETYERGRAMS